MNDFPHDRTRNPSHGTKPRRLAGAVAALTFVATLGGSTLPARAGGLLEEPCLATCGQYRWFLNHPKEVRDNAACCIRLIKQAKQKEERALELYEESRAPGLENYERNDLAREANKMITKRTKKIMQFVDCVNGVISALHMQQRGMDVTAEYAAACGITPLCEEEAGL